MRQVDSNSAAANNLTRLRRGNHLARRRPNIYAMKTRLILNPRHLRACSRGSHSDPVDFLRTIPQHLNTLRPEPLGVMHRCDSFSVACARVDPRERRERFSRVGRHRPRSNTQTLIATCMFTVFVLFTRSARSKGQHTFFQKRNRKIAIN